MGAVRTLWYRELIRFYRQRDRVIGALATPLVFWILIGSGFGASFRSSTSYLEYLYPGIIILSLLFTAIFSTISIIEDRREGFLQSVLVAPLSRGSMVLGKVLGATTIAVLQGAVFLLLGPFLGIEFSPVGLISTLLVLIVIAFAFGNLGFLIAWRSSSTQGFHAIMNLFLMPMWLLSGAFFPASGAPGWIIWIMRLNPLTYGMQAFRQALYHPPNAEMMLPLGVVAVFALLAFMASAATAQRTVAGDLA